VNCHLALAAIIIKRQIKADLPFAVYAAAQKKLKQAKEGLYAI
jgi:hypothetical protein